MTMDNFNHLQFLSLKISAGANEGSCSCVFARATLRLTPFRNFSAHLSGEGVDFETYFYQSSCYFSKFWALFLLQKKSPHKGLPQIFSYLKSYFFGYL